MWGGSETFSAVLGDVGFGEASEDNGREIGDNIEVGDVCILTTIIRTEPKRKRGNRLTSSRYRFLNILKSLKSYIRRYSYIGRYLKWSSSI